ncbi:zinc-binding metallopeptidase family protein [Piscinibacter sakaiensis]|uniref:zinc-binding metallopeptidase family protein n=1 Tax=Piscinibacter sakaiensis TaxID=1547922 RepID=UPI003AB08EEF
MTPFSCSSCGQTVFFENSVCGACQSALGYVPSEGRMQAFDASESANSERSGEPLAEGWLRKGGGGGRLRPCTNRVQHDICNWMLDAGDDHDFCISCRLTEVIPSLDNPINLRHWAAIETAKRRLVYTLMKIGLTPKPKTGPDDKKGLAFHLLESLPGEAPVVTGHDDGLITLNIAEADDVQREAARVSLREPVRTLLGHLRHEVSHYLQQRYVTGCEGEAHCREIFGDERADYQAALQTHYSNGPPADWSSRFVSEYASCHPWEDWAETCAHYLLVIDAVETASSWGLRLNGHTSTEPADGAPPQNVPLEELVLEHWLPVAQFLNAMNRSLGLPDGYPYLLPPRVLEKMSTVQTLLAQAAAGSKPAPEQTWEGEGGALPDIGSQVPPVSHPA